jgi:gliding motility-associated-like protein
MKIAAFIALIVQVTISWAQCTLIENGDFSIYGNPPPGFTSPDHTFNPTYPIACISGPEFGVGTSICPNPAGHWAGYTGDHTTGTGNALFVDISPWAPQAKIYMNNIITTPGEQYRFSYWGKNINGVVAGNNPSLDLEVDNVSQSSPKVFAYSGGWQYKEYIFTATNPLTNLNLHHTYQQNGNGHDLALDDVCAEPVFDSIKIQYLNTIANLCIGDTAKFQFMYYGYNGGICFNVDDGSSSNPITFQDNEVYKVVMNSTKTFTFFAQFCEGKQFTKSFSITVSTQFPADISSTDICMGDTNDVVINGVPGGSFSLVPPVSGSAIINPSNGEIYNYTSGSTYIIQYTNGSGSCLGFGYDTILVSPQDDANIDIPNFCANAVNQVIINGTTGGIFSFSPIPSDGASINSATGIISNAVAGASYSVQYQTTGVCSDVTSENISIIPTSDASFVMNDFCPGSIILPLITGDAGGTFSFDPIPSDGATIDPVSGLITTSSDDVDYFIKYSVGQCNDFNIVPVHVFEKPTATLSGTGTICDLNPDSLTIQFIGTPPFMFSFTDGTNTYNYMNYASNQFAYFVSNAKDYTMISVSDQFCSGDFSGQASFINGDIQFATDTAYGCPGFMAQFQVLSILDSTATCLWDFGDGQTFSGCTGAQNIFTEDGCHDVTLTVTASDGCVGSTKNTDFICTNPLPLPFFNQEPNKPTFFNNTVEFFNASSNAQDIYWLINGQYAGDELSVIHEFNTDTSTSQDVCLIAQSDSGCIDTLCLKFKIKEDFLIYVPNSFTPNDDDLNDVFFPIVSGIQTYTFSIFDRWGSIVFESKKPMEFWDGKINGSKQAQGVYQWQIDVKNNKNQYITRRGSVLMSY